MHPNPYKLGQIVSHNTVVVESDCKFIGDVPHLVWRDGGTDYDGFGILKLSEIAQQLINYKSVIRVIVDQDLFGVIFETGNYLDHYGEWIVYGITKGYA